MSRTAELEALARRQAELTQEIETLRASISDVLREIEWRQAQLDKLRLRMVWLRQPPTRSELSQPATVECPPKGRRKVARRPRTADELRQLIDQLAAEL